MGDPKKPRKKYESPRKPWDPELMETELRLIGEYGLKNRKELRSIEALLRKIRTVARSTYALPGSQRMEKTGELVSRLRRRGLIGEKGTIDDVLRLSLEHFLNRRLQTVLYKKGLARSIHQARQLVVHGHVVVGDRVVRKPSKLLSQEEESAVVLSPKSPLSRQEHPIWA